MALILEDEDSVHARASVEHLFIGIFKSLDSNKWIEGKTPFSASDDGLPFEKMGILSEQGY